MKTFAQSIQTYVKGIGDVTAIHRDSLREKWESRGLNGQLRDVDDDPLAEILGGLGAGLGTGLYTMNKPKVEPDGQPSGVTHRLCMVGYKYDGGGLIEYNLITGLCQVGRSMHTRSPANFQGRTRGKMSDRRCQCKLLT